MAIIACICTRAGLSVHLQQANIIASKSGCGSRSKRCCTSRSWFLTFVSHVIQSQIIFKLGLTRMIWTKCDPVDPTGFQRCFIPQIYAVLNIRNELQNVLQTNLSHYIMFIILSPTSVPYKFSLESGPKSLSKASLENTMHNNSIIHSLQVCLNANVMLMHLFLSKTITIPFIWT